MTDLYLLEPAGDTAWFPFHHSRPIAELRAGAWLIRERWESIAGAETRAVFGPVHLRSFVETDAPPVMERAPVEGPAIIGCSHFAPAGVTPGVGDGPACFVNDEEVVGWSVPSGTSWDGPRDDWPAVELEGFLLHGAYDVVTALEYLLPADVADFVHGDRDELPEGSIVIGDPAEVILLGAFVEPGVTFDVRSGAVVVEQHCYVKGGTRLEGPLYIGAGSHIHGGPIAHSAIGPVCRVRGEMSTTVMLGFANKGHDGFVGHSVIGRWANLGAGTTTSNLKNTYGDVSITIDGSRIATGRQYLGTLFGDHVKTAIGTMMTTGSTVGTGANLFGDGQPEKYVAPFSWGREGERMNLDGFLRTAAKVFERRREEFGAAQAAMLTAIYEAATG